MPDAWWTTDPASGNPVRVLPADAVERAQHEAFDADVKVAVLQECAARLRVIARRAVTESGASGDQARRDLYDAIDHMAHGDLAPDERRNEASS
jgi:hypothetical protein